MVAGGYCCHMAANTQHTVCCRVVYDIVLWLCERFDEECVAQVLLLLRNVGMQLRRDDPSALKTLIQMVKSKAADGWFYLYCFNAVALIIDFSQLDQAQGRVHFLLQMVVHASFYPWQVRWFVGWWSQEQQTPSIDRNYLWGRSVSTTLSMWLMGLDCCTVRYTLLEGSLTNIKNFKGANKSQEQLDHTR